MRRSDTFAHGLWGAFFGGLIYATGWHPFAVFAIGWLGSLAWVLMSLRARVDLDRREAVSKFDARKFRAHAAEVSAVCEQLSIMGVTLSPSGSSYDRTDVTLIAAGPRRVVTLALCGCSHIEHTVDWQRPDSRPPVSTMPPSRRN